MIEEAKRYLLTWKELQKQSPDMGQKKLKVWIQELGK
jgi:hypothetical protein